MLHTAILAATCKDGPYDPDWNSTDDSHKKIWKVLFFHLLLEKEKWSNKENAVEQNINRLYHNQNIVTTKLNSLGREAAGVTGKRKAEDASLSPQPQQRRLSSPRPPSQQQHSQQPPSQQSLQPRSPSLPATAAARSPPRRGTNLSSEPVTAGRVEAREKTPPIKNTPPAHMRKPLPSGPRSNRDSGPNANTGQGR